MRAQDAMTKNVITVGPDTTVAEIAALLVQNRISAVPVVASDGRLLGIVTQTDFGHRTETGTEKKRKWWLDAFGDPDAQAREFIKSHGRRAEDVMTRHIISVQQDASLADVADILDAHRIRQAPVMDGARLVGMISRSDLVRKFAEARAATSPGTPENGALQKAIWDAIKAQPWLQTAYINLTVNNGAVSLYGAAQSDDQRRALRILVEGVAGVRKVEDNLTLFPKVVAA